MKTRCFFALLASLLLACAAPGQAAEELSFKTREGRQFKKVFHTRTVGRKVEFMTATGLQTVHVADLPADLQQRFADPNAKPPPKIGDPIEFTTHDKRALKGVIQRIAPGELTIETTDGLEKIAFSNLPTELAESFDFTGVDATQYQAALRAQQQAIAVRQAADAKVAAKQAAEEKAAAERAAKDSAKGKAPSAQGFGERGSDRLGAPKLGGSGLDK